MAVEVLTAAISRSTDVTQLGTHTRAELNKKIESLMNAISAAKSVRAGENSVRAFIGEYDLRQTLQDHLRAAGVVFDVKEAAPDFLHVLADRGISVQV